MTIFNNQITSLLVAGLMLMLAAQHNKAESVVVPSDTKSDLQQIQITLDGFHTAAADADFDAYFAYFAEDAVFLGTDATERWPVKEFKLYVKPYFDKGQGWVYLPEERQVVIKNNIAWFDELLDSKSYGESRGSGVLLKLEGQWKIAQYNLHFPIPNDLVDEITDKIKLFQLER